jgi:hypothetical protein
MAQENGGSKATLATQCNRCSEARGEPVQMMPAERRSAGWYQCPLCRVTLQLYPSPRRKTEIISPFAARGTTR